jgi:hypothetical protein
MSLISGYVTELVARVGRENLDALPLKHVEAIRQNDDSRAVPIKLFFGYMRPDKKGPRKSIWVYLFPASSSTNSPEVALRHYESKTEWTRIPLDQIAGVAEDVTQPFKGMLSRNKVTSLARYYFLQKMVEMKIADDRLTYAAPPMTRLVDSLRLCCRVCKEANNEPKKVANTRRIAKVVSSPASKRLKTGNLGRDSERSERSITCLDITSDAISRYATAHLMFL